MPPRRRGNKGKQGTSGSALRDATSGDADEEATDGLKEPQLVLTSDKRRGIYECDYCHTDISQVPRIRCAVCPDFDLCLECFATTDHSAAISRLKAAATAYGALQDNEKQGSVPGISAAATNHVHTHGYRVADSTRYALFPTSRALSQSTKSDSGDGEADENDIKDENDEENCVGMEDEEEEVKEEPDKLPAADTDENMGVKLPSGVLNELQTLNAVDMTEERPMDTNVASEDRLDEAYFDAKTIILQDDNKSIWTIEEDLRLLDAISTYGLGNWADIAEAITGQGCSSKTPKRCMERYFDDFLGRYGHILPLYTIVGEAQSENVDEVEEEDTKSDDGDESRAFNKRRKPDRSPLVRSASAASNALASRRGKKLKVVPTASLPAYDDIWPDGYIPPIPRAERGVEVGRDKAVRAELTFVKEITNASTKEEAERIRKEWTETRLNQVGGPTALPMHPDDLTTLPGSELAGFMPRRGDFDMEWENDAEQVIADMEFSASDLPQDRQLKIQVVEIYNQKLDERERRKNFLLNRNLLDYRKNQQLDALLPRDERDLVRRMRLFERLHTPEEHKAFVDDIIRAKRLRKEIAKLQMYRRMGIKTLAEVERYELDKNRREFHKHAQLQKEGDTKPNSQGTPAAIKLSTSKESAQAASSVSLHDDVTSSLWKQYRTSDRKNRRSINRNGLGVNADTKRPEVDGAEGILVTVEMSDAQEKAVPKAAAGGNPVAEKPATVDVVDSSAKATVDAVPAAELAVTAETKDAPEAEPKIVECDDAGTEKPASEEVVGSSTANVPLAAFHHAEISQDDVQPTEVSAGGFQPTEVSPAEVKVSSKSPGYELLSTKETDLCKNLGLPPLHYLGVKKALIQESLRRGLLDKETLGSSKRSIVKIDVEKRGKVIDFMIRAGWISSKAGASAYQRHVISSS